VETIKVFAFTAFLCSAITAALLVITTRWHGRWSIDEPGSGPQKLHRDDTPRIGGVAIALGLFIALFFLSFGADSTRGVTQPLGLIAALCIPFAAGLYEDLTKAVGPILRLIATFVAAFIAYQFCGAAVLRFDMPVLDQLLVAASFMPLVLTMFCVGGVAHAFNLSDGLNGLLGGLTLIAAIVIGVTAHEHGDAFVAAASGALGGASAGFLLFNFPKSRLFAGDSGAYVVGTAVALLAILLVARNTAITPWLAFVSVLYPFTDTTFTIVRRMVQRQSIMAPDAEHLHSLIGRWFARHGFRHANAAAASVLLAVVAAHATLTLSLAATALQVAASCAVFGIMYSVAWFALSGVTEIGVASDDASTRDRLATPR
jgi:UDP-GlcNAc:undecaprenyl-phosphate/decaprenyl-phosphate GlcNAc-1-phosphate transferase